MDLVSIGMGVVGAGAGKGSVLPFGWRYSSVVKFKFTDRLGLYLDGRGGGRGSGWSTPWGHYSSVVKYRFTGELGQYWDGRGLGRRRGGLFK